MDSSTRQENNIGAEVDIQPSSSRVTPPPVAKSQFSELESIKRTLYNAINKVERLQQQSAELTST